MLRFGQASVITAVIRKGICATLIALAASVAVDSPAWAAADPVSCQAVRMSDVGWSDITATTAIASVLLKALGYTPRIEAMTVDGTFKALQTKTLDVFLGYWQPSQQATLRPYLATQSVEVLRVNLSDAKFTLAVPTYTYDKGLHSFADIAAFKDSLGSKIYGIETGNEGNHHILDLIRDNRFGLGGFKLIETNETVMLDEVARATAKSEDIVFLAWAPHQMNAKYKLSYLTGGDATFGPNYGEATVSTISRAGFDKDCPNAAALFGNLAFTSDQEAAPMGWIMDDKVNPLDAATRFLKANPAMLDEWLRGVTTFGGQSGVAAVRQSLGL